MPLFTSTSLTTFTRSIANAIRHVPTLAAPMQAQRARSAATLLRHLARTLHYAPRSSTYSQAPVRVTRSVPTRQAGSRLGASARRVSVPSGAGPRINASVGLGKARAFSGGPGSDVLITNVPIGLRAIAALLSDDKTSRGLPGPSIYPSPRLAKRRRQRVLRYVARRFATPEVGLTDSQVSAKLFGAVTAQPQYVTLGAMTTLDIYVPSSISFAAPSVTLVSPAYLAAHFGPTRERVEAVHDCLRRLGMGQSTGGEVWEEEQGVMDGSQGLVRFVFHGRSVDNVAALLVDALPAIEENRLWRLYDVPAPLLPAINANSGLPSDMSDLKEDWTNPSASQIDSSALIFPIIDLSASEPTAEEPKAEDIQLASGRTTPETQYSWPSGASTPSSLYPIHSPLEGIEISSPPRAAGAVAMLSSVMSNWGENVLPDQWSDDESEVESLLEPMLRSMSGAHSSLLARSQSEVELDWQHLRGNVDEAELGEAERAWSTRSEPDSGDEASMYGSWAGTGQGFGFVQPW